ncbi:MAG: signal peptidase I [Bacilli bacterium]|nr:signal peptidase I [Bacilli bacterium]MBR4672162.1 signal peptidase I [Bacilli bacterium]
MKALKIGLKLLKALLTILVILVLIIVIVQKVSGNKVRMFGYGVYTVLTGSMEPEYEVGDMLLAKEVAKDDIKVGNDLVYQGEVGDFSGKIVTHRVIAIDSKIHTKGIANDFEDPEIEYSQVQGRVISKLTVLSAFSKLMNNTVMFYIMVFVPFSILIFLDIRDIVLETQEKKAEKNKEAEVIEETKTEIVEEKTTEIIEEVKEENKE